MKKHLLYFIYPGNKNMLLFNLEQLSQYIHLFNGKRNIYVATDFLSIQFNEVKNIISSYGINANIVKVENNKVLKEAAHFRRLLSTVRNEQGITFYAHAKGITRDDDKFRKPVLNWIYQMYRNNLGLINQVEAVFEREENIHVAGIFRRIGNMKPVNCPWHFSGSFFWFRNSELFRRQWQHIRGNAYATEAFPSDMFGLEESICLRYDHAGNLYKVATWKKMNIEII